MVSISLTKNTSLMVELEVRGDKARRKEGKKSDYSLYYQFGTRIAIVEAKG
ncbi:Type I restriction-modification system protein [Streptococcus pneumoniae]|nr:Type I restriction-modification system protein [Streptococcus pneumoniae]